MTYTANGKHAGDYLEDLTAVVREMLGKNIATTRFHEGGIYSVNIPHLTGPETAHLHPKAVPVVREALVFWSHVPVPQACSRSAFSRSGLLDPADIRTWG